jgi:pimeloyl-ACP methyl ester carboxylesterase
MTWDNRGRSRTFPFGTRFVDLPAGRVAYFDEGEGDALIFVHGLVGDFTHFEHVAPAFASGFRVIGLDMPGCGISDKRPQRHTVAAYADTVLALMDVLGITRATLVGHSAGGLVSATAALGAPHRVERLVLVNSAGLRRYAPGVRWLARGLLRPWLLTATLERLAMPMLDHVFVARNEYTAKFIRDSLDRPRHPTLGEMAKVFSDLGPELVAPGVLDHAERLTMPMMVLWGDGDRLIPPSAADELASRVPTAWLRMLPRCGHMPIIEQPDAVIRALGEFLGEGRRERFAA